jgi:hypothetical protein
MTNAEEAREAIAPLLTRPAPVLSEHTGIVPAQVLRMSAAEIGRYTTSASSPAPTDGDIGRPPPSAPTLALPQLQQ